MPIILLLDVQSLTLIMGLHDQNTVLFLVQVLKIMEMVGLGVLQQLLLSVEIILDMALVKKKKQALIILFHLPLTHQYMFGACR